MANDYNYYANESVENKERRVNGYGLHKLQEKLNLSNNETNDSYNKDKQQISNNRIYTQRKKMNDNMRYTTNHDSLNINNHNHNVNKNKNNEQNINFYHVNNQSLSYATDMHLSPLRIKCNPNLPDRNFAVKFVQELFKTIENSFRNIYSEHKKALGFDYWWIDKMNGDLVGISKDTSLYVYLCDVRNYPEQIDSVRLTPILPIHLPPQHAIIIKSVPNDYHFIDLEEDLKQRYSSIYHIEEMNGTRRTHSRHIRMDIYDKNEYNDILNSSTITLGGLLCEVDEYLPAPKILICTKCNSPGHAKKVCRLDYERCRRCGEDRNNGDSDHKNCITMCHHCGGDHQANDYKCPVLLDFRRDLIEQLRNNPNKLPPHIQMFIPFNCRIEKSEKILINRTTNDYKKHTQTYTYHNSLHEWPTPGKSTTEYNGNINLDNLQIDLDSLKSKYQMETEKINLKLQQQSTYIHKSWSMMQGQINLQKEIIDSTASIVNDLSFNMNSKVTNIINNFIQLFNDIIPDDQTKNKLIMWQEELKNQNQYLCERQIAYNNHIKNLDQLWIKQSSNIDELFDLCLSNNQNVQ